MKELWLDSSEAFSPARVREIQAAAQAKGVALYVHAQVHFEMCRKQRAKSGARFDPSLIDSFLDQLGIQVATVTFDRDSAARWAERIHGRHDSSEAWQAAKLQCLKARLPEGSTWPTERVPVTADWLIALEVEDRGAHVVVEDKGPEWGALRDAEPKRALTHAEALDALKALPPITPE